MKRVFGVLLCSLALTATMGCDSFERDSFNTLASSKAVIDQAQQDYEPPPVGTGKLPHTQCVYTAINKAKAAQSVAVEAMLGFEQAKAAKANLSQPQAAVTADLLLIAPIIVQIKTISAGGACQAVSENTPSATTYGDNSPAITGNGNVVYGGAK